MQDQGQAKEASGSASLDYGEEETLNPKTKADKKKKKKKSARFQLAGAGRRVPGAAAPAAASALGTLSRLLPRDRGRTTHAPTRLPKPAPTPSFRAGWPALRRPRRRRQEEPGAPATHTTELQARRAISGGGGSSSGGDSSGCSSQGAPCPRRACIPPPLRREAADGPRVPSPGSHGQAPRTIAAATAAVPSLSARHEEAGEEGMRLQALPQE